MKVLIIVRHAKSSWEDPRARDHDRKLLATGVRKTKRMAQYLRQKGIMPGLMLSSTAVRALETARIIAGDIGYPENEIRTESNLYHGSTSSILQELYGISDSIDSVMVFGHNPALTYFVNQFLDPAIENLPTSGMVSISFDTDRWTEISGAGCKVDFLVTPKSLKNS